MNKQEILRAKASSPVTITTLLTQWDTCDLALGQVKYLLEEDDDAKARLASLVAEAIKDLPEQVVNGRAEVAKQVRAKFEDTLFNEVCEDQDLYTREYDDLCDYLTETLKKLSPDGYFKAEMKSFGWQARSGYKYLQASTGKELLQKILPKTECTFRIFRVKGGRALAIQNFHHDSPTGNEFYVIKPCASSTYHGHTN
jgi:hypothetical protein